MNDSNCSDAGHINNAFEYQALCLVQHLFSNSDFLKDVKFFAYESKNDYRIKVKDYTIFAQVKHVDKINISSFAEVKKGFKTLKVNFNNDSDSAIDEYLYVTTSRNLFGQKKHYMLSDSESPKTYNKKELENYFAGLEKSLEKLLSVADFSNNIYFKIFPFTGRNEVEKFRETIKTVYKTLYELKLYGNSDYLQAERLVYKLVSKVKVTLDGKTGAKINKIELIADTMNEAIRALIDVSRYEDKYIDNPLGMDTDFIDEYIKGDSKIYRVIDNYLNDFSFISKISSIKRATRTWKNIDLVTNNFTKLDSEIGYLVDEIISNDKLSDNEVLDIKKFVFYVFAVKEKSLSKAQEVI